MNKNKPPKELAIDLMGRSVCNVTVGAVIMDGEGRLISHGWNNVGPEGKGECAEKMAIRRANPKRLKGSTMMVAGAWKQSGNPVESKPCDSCMNIILAKAIREVHHTTKSGGWRVMKL